MHGDAGVAGAEDRMDPVDTADRAAARSGGPFVAGSGSIVEIVTARTLEEVAAGRGGVPKLRRRAGEDGTGKKRVAFDDLRMPGQVAVADQRADPQTSGFRSSRSRTRKPEVYEVGAAGQYLDARAGKGRDRVSHGFGTDVIEPVHSAASELADRRCRTSSMASAMLV